MTRNLLFGTMFSAALAAGVAAQGGSTGSGTASQTRAQDQQSQVTVSGCLQNADMKGSGATAGTSGSGTTGSGTTGSGSQTARSGSGDAQFMLTNATVARTSSQATGSSGSGTGSATSGTSGSGTSSATKRFALVGGDQQNLRQYLNSQVEIQGRLDEGKSATGAGAPTATGGSTASSASGSGMSDIAKLHVASVRQIATTCTDK